MPTLSPAWPESRSLRNISTPVTTVFWVSAQADDLDLLADLDHALLDAAGDDGATTGDGHDVLDRHQERLVGVAHRARGCSASTAAISSMIPFASRRRPRAPSSARDADDRGVVAGELVLVQQLAHLELDEVEELLVVDHVGLVERDDDRRDADLAGEQHVLTGLGHRAVGGRDDEDGAVDLGGAGDHVLDVVGVARHVDVGVVALVRLVLDVGDRDGDATRLLLGRLVDLVERA